MLNGGDMLDLHANRVGLSTQCLFPSICSPVHNVKKTASCVSAIRHGRANSPQIQKGTSQEAKLSEPEDVEATSSQESILSSETRALRTRRPWRPLLGMAVVSCMAMLVASPALAATTSSFSPSHALKGNYRSARRG